jgi:hypothetical protein
MTRTTLLARAALALGCALAFSPAAAHAGLSSYYAYCSKNTDGSGFCQGSMQSFVKNADPAASAQFSMGSGSSTPWFNAYLSGAGYFCLATDAYPEVKQFWPQLVNARSSWFITWNSSGICNYASVSNASAYP